MKSLKRIFGFSCLTAALFLLPSIDVQAMEDKDTKVLKVEMFALTSSEKDGIGESIGDVWVYLGPTGMVFLPTVEGLPLGEHGMHIHEFDKLGPGKAKNGKLIPGLQAGGHYDPMNTGKHLGPYNENGHFGDLPKIIVDPDGMVDAVVAPRITSFTQINNKALIIHLYGDNYSDSPKALGGGGRRIAGGIIKVQ